MKNKSTPRKISEGFVLREWYGPTWGRSGSFCDPKGAGGTISTYTGRPIVYFVSTRL